MNKITSIPFKLINTEQVRVFVGLNGILVFFKTIDL